MAEEEKGVRVRLHWPADANADPQFVNQFAFMPGHPVGPEGADEGTYYLIFGHVPPPMYFSQEDFEEALGEGRDIEVRVRSQIMMGRARAVEFWHVLGQTLGLLPDEETGGDS